jgi:hypothetical protein
MFKLNFTLLIIIVNLINLIATDCSDRHLSCFNNKKESGVFCKYCAIFANSLPKKRNLINQPKN